MSANRGTRRGSAVWVQRARRAGMRGEQLLAFDLARQGLALFPDDLSLQHQSVFALLQSGARGEAWRRFHEYGLARQRVHPPIAALEARLLKEDAFDRDRVRSTEHVEAAARAYRRLFQAHQVPWYGIDAASLLRLAGKRDARLERVLMRLCNPQSQRGQQRFMTWATLAEAHLLLGDTAAAVAALKAARRALRRLRQPDYSLLTGVRVQLRRLAPALGVDVDTLLEPLRAPGVVFYFGRSARGAGRRRDEPSADIAAFLRQHDIRFGYGSLTAGADLCCAEALLAHGAALHVVLPCGQADFERHYVDVAGRSWRQRFRAALAAATSVQVAGDDGHQRLSGSHDYAMDLGIGTALLRAQALDAPLRTLALTDGSRGNSTATLLGRCQRLGLSPTRIRYVPARGHSAHTAPTPSLRRHAHAIVFGDLSGFSTVSDVQLPAYVDQVLGRFAAVLGRHRRQVLFRNTWGDGLFVIVRDAPTAARIAGELHDALSTVPGAPLALRLGLHFGPVLARRDPVLGRTNYFGSHVSRTARIEPVTPAGQTYVTEAFAAQLLLHDRQHVHTEYVGEIPAAKGYGSLRMYVLGR